MQLANARLRGPPYTLAKLEMVLLHKKLHHCKPKARTTNGVIKVYSSKKSVELPPFQWT